MSDPILDAPITSDSDAYALWIHRWAAIQEAAADWYREAMGHEPASADIGHGTWRGLVEHARWGTLRNAFQDTWPKPVEPGPTPILGPITTDGQIWLMDGRPWRWKGVTAFGLGNKFRNGENIDGFLEDYRGFNVLREFDHTLAKDGWNERAWAPIPVDVWVHHINAVGDKGWMVELVLVTSDDPAYIQVALNLIAGLRAAWANGSLRYKPFLEAGNEPLTHKTINVEALRVALEQSGFFYTSGIFEDSDKFFGSYYVTHDPRVAHFPRYCHNPREAWEGRGPDKPHVWRNIPCIGDEPGKQQDLGSNDRDWRAFFGGYALMGAGATRHTETGKFGDRPTESEKLMNVTVLSALNEFPEDAPKGNYGRIVEPGNEPDGPTKESRTYLIGQYAVRCQQEGNSFPEPGYTPLDTVGVLWRKS